MAHTGIYATSAECIAAAGDNYASTAVNEAMINTFCLQAEGTINAIARKAFAVDITAFTAMPAGGKYILTTAEVAMVGIDMLKHKPTGEDGALKRLEFEDRIATLRDIKLMCFSLLRDEKIRTFIITGA